MLQQLLPRQADNSFRGSQVALWLFGLLLLMKLPISINSIFFGHMVATSADGFPLDTYPSAAAQTIISMFAIWGIAHLIFCILGVLVLIRYRALVPLMFALLLAEQLSRKLILHFLPIASASTSTGYVVNLVLPVLMIAGLAFSFLHKGAAGSNGSHP